MPLFKPLNLQNTASQTKKLNISKQKHSVSKKKQSIHKKSSSSSTNDASSLVPDHPSSIKVTRSVSACLRCRLRKTRCDQKFPSCSACQKVGVECLDIDSATGREISRSYVFNLENRITLYESKLKEYEKVQPSGALEIPTANDTGYSNTSTASTQPLHTESRSSISCNQNKPSNDGNSNGVKGIMSSVRSVSPKAATSAPSAFLGFSSGLSFARLLLTAIKFNSNTISKLSSNHLSSPSCSASSVQSHNVLPAALPAKHTAEKFLRLFFTHANSQLPIIHRNHFLTSHFIPVYGPLSGEVSLKFDYDQSSFSHDSPLYQSSSSIKPYTSSNSDSLPTLNCSDPPKDTEKIPEKSLYFLNIIFAIATSITHQTHATHTPHSFYLAAMQHFDTVLASQNRLEALQGILLLALYSIMQPAVPGVWYVLGWALRLCVDLGLHTEIVPKPSACLPNHDPAYDPFILDLRRRLFWCTYAIDRQVCVYLGRPFGIPEESIKVAFPSQLDDDQILSDSPTHLDSIQPDPDTVGFSYKSIALCFFRIRKIQAEIQQILYECAELPRHFTSLGQWRTLIHQKLELWHHSCLESAKTVNIDFNFAFLELNYNQTRLLLYGPSPSDSSSKPIPSHIMIVAQAGENVINLYHNLHHHRRINYTWVAVHNLFMAGTSYLYALYHLPSLREITSIDQINATTQKCTKVLQALVDRCDAAISCYLTFKLLTGAILKLCTEEKSSTNRNSEPVSFASHDFKPEPPIDQARASRTATKSFTGLPTIPNHFKHQDQGIYPAEPILTDLHSESKPVLPHFSTGHDYQSGIDQTSSKLAASIKEPQHDSLSQFPSNHSHSDKTDLDLFLVEAGIPISKDKEVQNWQPPTNVSKPSIVHLDQGSPPSTANNEKLVSVNHNVSYQPNPALRYASELADTGGLLDFDNVSAGTEPQVFELMNQVPASAIWNQFFAGKTSSPAISPNRKR